MDKTNTSMLYNGDTEQDVIGAILRDNNAITETEGILTPDDFFDLRHKKIFGLILEADRAGGGFDSISVSDAYRKAYPKENTAAAEDYIDDMSNLKGSGALIRVHARTIRNFRMVRQTEDAASNAITDIRNGMEALEIIARLEIKMEAARDLNPDRKIQTVKDIVENLADSLMNPQSYTQKEYLNTGYSELDAVLGGIEEGSLVLLAARPSIGKSALAINIVINLMKQRKRCGIFSLEIPEEKTIWNMACVYSGINTYKRRNGEITSEDIVKIKSAKQFFCGGLDLLYVDDTSLMTSDELRHRIRVMKKNYGIKFVVVDYLQLLKTRRKHSNRQEEVEEISRDLKTIAMEQKIVVLALSQLNRKLEERGDNRPRLYDLRNSGSLEQDADVVLLLHRDLTKTNEEKNVASLEVAKNRHGETRMLSFLMTPQFLQFRPHFKNVAYAGGLKEGEDD